MGERAGVGDAAGVGEPAGVREAAGVQAVAKAARTSRAAIRVKRLILFSLLQWIRNQWILDQWIPNQRILNSRIERLPAWTVTVTDVPPVRVGVVPFLMSRTESTVDGPW